MEIVTKFLDWVLALLPHSPFASFLDELEGLPFLGYLNYFFPVGTCIKIGEAWLVAVGLFYLYSIILRWIRAID